MYILKVYSHFHSIHYEYSVPCILKPPAQPEHWSLKIEGLKIEGKSY